jgi:flotillin
MQIELAEHAKREELAAHAAEEQRVRDQMRAIAELKAATELAEEKAAREQSRAIAELKAATELADERGAREQARLLGELRAKTQLEQEKAAQAEAVRLAQLARERKYAEAERQLLEVKHATQQKEVELGAQLAMQRNKANTELKDLESAAAARLKERELQLERLAGEVRAAVARAAREVDNLVSDDRIRMALVETGLPAIAGAFAQKFGEVKITAFGDGADPSAMVARGMGEVLALARKVGADLLTPPAPPVPADSQAER